MKRILTIVLSTALFAACGEGGNSDDSQDYVDSTNVTPNNQVNPSSSTNLGEGAGLDTNGTDAPGRRTNPGSDSAIDTSR